VSGFKGPRKAMRSHLVFSISVVTVLIMSAPALAQPRPPADVDYPPSQRDIPDRYPPQFPGQQRPPPQQYPQQYPPQRSPGAVQSEPMPPPPGIPGGTIMNPQQGQQRAPAQQPGGAVVPPDPRMSDPSQGRQKTKARQQPQQPQSPDQPEAAEVPVQQAPIPRISNPTAVFTGLDKITGRIINFEVSVDETVQFGALQVTPRACYTRPPTEIQNTTSFVEVDEITLQGDIKRIFTGWMFAASPGLHGVEHAIYDVWVTDCKTTPPAIAASGSKK